MAPRRRDSRPKRDVRDVVLFTTLVLLIIVVIFFLVGYLVGTRLV